MAGSFLFWVDGRGEEVEAKVEAEVEVEVET